jgi:Bacterial extracellular solute-binding proteins, family 5 Middle
MTPTSSAVRRPMAVLLQEQWRRIGAKVSLELVEPNLFFERLAKGQYDAAINAWHTDPSPSSARQIWGSTQTPDQGGSNYSSYVSPVFDACLDSAGAQFTRNGVERTTGRPMSASRPTYRQYGCTRRDTPPACTSGCRSRVFGLMPGGPGSRSGPSRLTNGSRATAYRSAQWHRQRSSGSLAQAESAVKPSSLEPA